MEAFCKAAQRGDAKEMKEVLRKNPPSMSIGSIQVSELP